MQIASGDSSVGGTKAWVTSEFAFARALMALMALLYGFFGSIAAAWRWSRDDEAQGRATCCCRRRSGRPSTCGASSWRSSPASCAPSASICSSPSSSTTCCPTRRRWRSAGRSTWPTTCGRPWSSALPTLVFYLGVSFFLGERWRRPVTVFLFPIALLLLCGFFLWSWAPTWLDLRINQFLMLIDPSGFRWINETWIKLDRGAGFYNTARVGIDLPFLLSRLAFLGVGLLGVVLAQRHLAAHLQGQTSSAGDGTRRWFRRRNATLEASPGEAGGTTTGATTGVTTGAVVPFPRSLADLRMRTGGAGLVQGTLEVAGTELRNLLASPGLYLFGVLILVQTLGNSLIALGPFQTELLITPGEAAVQSMETLSLLLGLLLMFYTVESIERERADGPRGHLLLDAGAHGLAALRQGARQQRGRPADGGRHLPGLRHRHPHPGKSGAQPRARSFWPGACC